MELLHLATVDSTSSHAARLVADGRKAPFAVWADVQTGGRGRRGNQWASPAGNLFLTLVLPPPAPGGEGGLLPLRAGVVVARLIERATGVRVTLKWPNDLLFAGRKLGGLLLEGSISGRVAGEVLVGLGLNLSEAPALQGTYAAVSLREILGREMDVAEWAERIAGGFEAEWSSIPDAAVPAAFDGHGIGEGQLWVSGDGKLARAGAVQKDGSLSMAELPAVAAQLLRSVDHGWRWLYQGAEDAPLAVADVGNTSTKLAWMPQARAQALGGATGGEFAATVAVPHDAPPGVLAEALRQLADRAPAHPWPLHILSVNPAAAQQLADAANAAGLSPLRIPKRPVRRHGDGYELAGLGADRLAAIEGWLARSGRPVGRAGIVVAAGTATTIDAVAADGRHLGGLILPGLATALDSLHRAASLLPAVAAPRDAAEAGDDVLGHDTRSAMARAALEMTVGAVERVRRAAAPDADIVVTGGWGRAVAARLGAEYDEGLVLSGARVMVLGGLL